MLQVCGHIKHVVVLVALHACHHFICCPCSHTLTFSPACEFLADFVDSHAAKTGLLMCCECESNEITNEEYHNHAVNPARPPAQQTMESLFDKTAGLKRFHSHSHQLHTFLHNVGWEGGLSKITRSVALDQNSNKRHCTRDLDPPTPPKQCKFVSPHTSALCSSPQSCSESRPPTRTTDDGIPF